MRIKGTTAFVIFRPAGGPRSYFVMKREKGAWKATSLVPGFPLRPVEAEASGASAPAPLLQPKHEAKRPDRGSAIGEDRWPTPPLKALV